MTPDVIFDDAGVFNFELTPLLPLDLLPVVSERGFKHLVSEVCTLKKELDLPWQLEIYRSALCSFGTHPKSHHNTLSEKESCIPQLLSF